MRKTKIIATVGPASSDKIVLEKLIQSGVNVVRCNFSHGSYKDHEKVIKTVREISREAGRPVAILQDLQGPKIRLGTFKDGKAYLKTGERITLTAKQVIGDTTQATVTYKSLAKDTIKGDSIYINDGLIKLKVEKVSGDEVRCVALEGGWLSDRKGVNLPSVKLSCSSLTEKDKADLKFGLSLGVDYTAISFVRQAKDVQEIKNLIIKAGRSTPVVAKIEKKEALEDIKNIIKIADGIMVARGDLGVELSFEKVPGAQKMLIDESRKEGIPVIVATQMLESMINSPVPTRAEASDIANAVFDGADCVMLSGETAAGKYPVESVKMMEKIILEAEAVSDKWQAGLGFSALKGRTDDKLDAIGYAVYNISREISVSKIIVFTRSGQTACLVSHYRPKTDIIAFTPKKEILQKMVLYRGVNPHLLGSARSTEEMLSGMTKILLAKKLVRKSGTVIVVFGMPVSGQNVPANTIKLHTI